MKDTLKCLRSGLVLLLFCALLGACRGEGNLSSGQITEIQSPDELSPELKGIQFYLFKKGDFGSKVLIQTLDRTDELLYHNPGFISRVDVSPKGKDLVYVQMTSVGDLQPIWMYWVDLDSGEEHKIAGWDKDFDEISISNPSFTSDGQQVLFTVTRYDTGLTGLARVSIDGSDLVVLDTDIPLTEGPESSPDGSMIIVACAGYDSMTRMPGFQLCLLDREGQYIKYLTNRGIGHSSKFFTPDGKKVVFTEFDPPKLLGLKKPARRFYAMDLETDEKTLLLNWDLGVLGFSASGEEIIFEGRPNGWSPWRIYVINIDGTNLRHLAYFDDFLDEWYDDAREY
jgi:Tol biopolymer transport system component